MFDLRLKTSVTFSFSKLREQLEKSLSEALKDSRHSIAKKWKENINTTISNDERLHPKSKDEKVATIEGSDEDLESNLVEDVGEDVMSSLPVRLEKGGFSRNK